MTLRNEDSMKIWEKIYLFVIILFLLVLNICNIIVFRSSYEKSLESVEKTAVSFWRHIASSMAEDMAENGEDETLEWQLFQTYVSEYSTPAILLNCGEKENFAPNRRAERRLHFLLPRASCSLIF